MKTSTRTYRALSTCAVAFAFAACAESQPPIGATGAMPQLSSQSHGIVKRSTVTPSYKTSGPLLYVGSLDLNVTPLAIYRANRNDPKPFASISKDIDMAGGLCIDSNGTLYVANDPGSAGWVSEYSLGQTKPLRVITNGINTPAFCAIDASGNLWVTNIGLDNVAEYLKGSTKPHATITKGLTHPDGIAIDDAGNIYVGNLMPPSASNIQVYSPGSKSPSRTITDGITWPVGIAVDSHDTLYVANDTAPGNVEEYRSGESKPYRTITDELVNSDDVLVGKDGLVTLHVAREDRDINGTPFKLTIRELRSAAEP